MTEDDITIKLLSAQNLSTRGLIQECLKIAKKHGAKFDHDNDRDQETLHMITESAFKAQCVAGFKDPENPEMIAECALLLAKKHGAKFREETATVDLPDLTVSGCRTESYTHSVCTAPLPRYSYGRALTFEEAQEVVRRCRVVKKLQDFIATRTSGQVFNSHDIQTLISILKEGQ